MRDTTRRKCATEFSRETCEGTVDWPCVDVQHPPLSLSGWISRFVIDCICVLGQILFFVPRLVRRRASYRVDQIGRILVVRRGGLGDGVMILPLLAALREQYPYALIHAIVSKQAAAALQGNANVDDVILSPSGVKPWLRLIWTMRATQYDVAFVLHRFFAVPVLMLLAGIPRRIGFAWRRHGFALTASKPYDVRRSQGRQVSELLGLIGAPVPEGAPRLQVDAAEMRAAELRLATWEYEADRPLVCIHPGGAARFGVSGYCAQQTPSTAALAGHPPRRWFAARFGQLADRLIAEGVQVVITQGPADEEAVEEMLAAMRAKPLAVAPQMSLAEFAALLHQCDLAVLCDSGPMHVAQAAGCRVVSIFGPTHAGNVAPLGSGDRVAWAGLACSPCIDPDVLALTSSWTGAKDLKCWKGTCECMAAVSVESVLRLVQQLLEDLKVLH